MKLFFLTSALASASIIDRIADKHGNDFATSLANHGCHCKKLSSVFDKDNVGGTPVDDLDALCRDFFSAKSCMSLIDGSCQNIDISSFEDKSSGCGSSAPGTCGSEICLNNEDFLDNLGNYIGMAVSASVQCSSTQTTPKSHCCGDYPSLLKFTEEQYCVNGQLADSCTYGVDASIPETIDWSNMHLSQTLSVTDGSTEPYLKYNIKEDDKYMYVPGSKSGYSNDATIWVYDRCNKKQVKTYGSTNMYFTDVAITDKYVIGADYRKQIAVFDKDTGVLVSSTSCTTCHGAIGIDGDLLIVTTLGPPGIYRLNDDGTLTDLAGSYLSGGINWYEIQQDSNWNMPEITGVEGDGGVSLWSNIEYAFPDEGIYSNWYSMRVAFDDDNFYVTANYAAKRKTAGTFSFNKQTLKPHMAFVERNDYDGHTGMLEIAIWGDYLITTCTKGKIFIWNKETGEEVIRYVTDENEYDDIHSMEVVGNYLITATHQAATYPSPPAVVHVRDLNAMLNGDQTPIRTFNDAETTICQAMGFSPELKEVWVGCADGKINIYDLSY